MYNINITHFWQLHLAVMSLETDNLEKTLITKNIRFYSLSIYLPYVSYQLKVIHVYTYAQRHGRKAAYIPLHWTEICGGVVNFALFLGTKPAPQRWEREIMLSQHQKPALQHLDSYTYKCSNYPGSLNS